MKTGVSFKVTDKMTRIGRRLIEDFLLPALNEEKYGDLLKWIDKEKCYFSIRWSHKNAAKWTLDDTAVFQDWDRLKGHYRPEVKGYYMQAKQRFRAALYKLSTVKKLPCEDKHVKKYQLTLNHEKRHELMSRKTSSRMSPYMHSQKSIPTPVICRNTSFIAKAEENYAEESSSSSPPSSPASSTKSEGSVVKVQEEVHKCLEEYQLASKSQWMMKMIKTGGYARVVPELTRNYLDCPSSILRESPQLNMMRRTPHVPIQPVPVYNKCNVRQVVESPQKRVESPHVLLVPTYNDSDMEIDPDRGQTMIEIKEEMNEECSEHNCENSEVALNLSTKCDDIETLSR